MSVYQSIPCSQDRDTFRWLDLSSLYLSFLCLSLSWTAQSCDFIAYFVFACDTCDTISYYLITSYIPCRSLFIKHNYARAFSLRCIFLFLSPLLSLHLQSSPLALNLCTKRRRGLKRKRSFGCPATFLVDRFVLLKAKNRLTCSASVGTRRIVVGGGVAGRGRKIQCWYRTRKGGMRAPIPNAGLCIRIISTTSRSEHAPLLPPPPSTRTPTTTIP